MLNHLEITAGVVAPAAYEIMDGLCLFLCKECLQGLPKLHLPEQLAQVIL